MITERSLEKASEDSLKLLGYVSDCGRGELLTYTEVEADTGVVMNVRGKARLRWAILRCGYVYEVVRKVGYRLGEPENAMRILTGKLAAIDSRVRAADRAHRVVDEQFFQELPREEQQHVRQIGAIFGAIRLTAENGKKLYGRPLRQIANTASSAAWQGQAERGEAGPGKASLGEVRQD